MEDSSAATPVPDDELSDGGKRVLLKDPKAGGGRGTSEQGYYNDDPSTQTGPVESAESRGQGKGVAEVSTEGQASADDTISPTPSPATVNLKVFGLRVEDHSKGIEFAGGVGALRANTKAVLRLFGEGFTDETEVLFTAEARDRGDKCTTKTTDSFRVSGGLCVVLNWAAQWCDG